MNVEIVYTHSKIIDFTSAHRFESKREVADNSLAPCDEQNFVNDRRHMNEWFLTFSDRFNA